MNLLCRFVGLAVFASANFLPYEHALAQSSDVTATIQFSNGDSITVTDFSNEIGVQLNEFINITVQFPPQAIGQPVVVETFDGGTTTVGSSIPVVDSDGTLNFGFFAPSTTGSKSIRVRSGTTVFCLQFSAADASRP